MPRWTEQQQAVIDARGGGLLVSAAAGSGKTAVLTERITSRILDREHPVEASRFLVVTFTRAAAAEMRTRIRARLREALAENPGDTFLQRQMLLLGQAKICTMDSFFHSLVRENAPQLGLSPNLRGVDDAMLTKMTTETLRALLEEQYLMADHGENPDFAELTGYFGAENDQALSDEILSLYTHLRSIPFPENWLSHQLSLYADSTVPVSESLWGKEILSQAEGLFSDAASLYDKAVRAAFGEGENRPVSEKVFGMLEGEKAAAVSLSELAHAGDWDAVYKTASGLFAGHRLTFLKTASPMEKDTIKSFRDTAKALIEQAAALFVCTESEFHEDLAAEYRVLRIFFSLVQEFSSRMKAAKEAAGVADFGDFASLALSLVANPDGTPTSFAKELSEQYEEIMLDEYQDTNRLQDMIFRCISKNGENLFYVGDLKQSIYRFRSANPAVFIEKKDAFARYDGEHFPALALLSKNFRSRLSVTKAVNALFSCVMSRKTGDVDYNEEEALYCGADYYPPLPESEAEVTLQLIDGKNLSPDSSEEDASHAPEGADSEEPVSLYLLEARALAARFKKMIDSGEQVYDKETGALRPCRGGDFVILMRSVRGLDSLYAEALREAGIDAQLCTASGYFDSREVSLMISLLQLLDNPARDTALAAVLISPIFSFDCDDLARLTLSGKSGSLYRALLQEADGDSLFAEKDRRFLTLFSQLRKKSAVSPISTLIQYIYDQTDFIEVMNRTSGGGARENNLRLLLRYASDYEAGGNSELAGFVSYLGTLAGENTDFRAAVPLSEAAGAVRIMTIHRSKGLEFPIVAIAACSRRFNIRELSGMTLFHAEMGFGMRRVEREALRKYPTLAYTAVGARQRADMISEEMRLLYVAATRARERLILCVSEKDLGASLKRVSGLWAGAEMGAEDGKISSAASARCQRYADWILAALIRHPAMSRLRTRYEIEEPGLGAADFPLCVDLPEPEKTEAAAEKTAPSPDPSEEELLSERFSWQYPDAPLSEIPAKLSVTRITHPVRRVHLSVPRFAGSGLLSEECGDTLLIEKRAEEGADANESAANAAGFSFTPAQKGTIFHRALQFSDYEKGAADPEAELSRLIEARYLTPKEAGVIPLEEFSAFFRSDLIKRMLASSEVLREYKFFDTIPASEAGYPEGGNAGILLQGIADCIFLEGDTFYLVDFKTDRVRSMKTLESRYASQLFLYRCALSHQPRFAGKHFGGSFLYSTCLGKTLLIEGR